MNLIIEKLNAENPIHCEAAELTAFLSDVSDTMATYTTEEIIDHPYGVVAFNDENNDFVGYVAVKDLSQTFYVGEKNVIGKRTGAIVGALAVNEAHKGNGASTHLLKYLISTMNDELPVLGSVYAFANSKSLGAFSRCGASIEGTRVPASPTGCNTVVDLSLAKYRLHRQEVLGQENT